MIPCGQWFFALFVKKGATTMSDTKLVLNTHVLRVLMNLSF